MCNRQSSVNETAPGDDGWAKLKYQSALMELHTLDGIAEQHTHTVLVLQTALLAFLPFLIDTIGTKDAVRIVGSFAFLVNLEWFVKLFRFIQVSKEAKLAMKHTGERSCYQRPDAFLGCTGFRLLIAFSLFLMTFWSALIGIAVRSGDDIDDRMEGEN
jgi:hypothetical protein